MKQTHLNNHFLDWRREADPVTPPYLLCFSGFGAPYGYSPAGALPPYGKLTASLSFGSIIHLFYSSPHHLSSFIFFSLLLRFSLQIVLSSCPNHQSPHSIPPRLPPLPLLGPSPPPSSWIYRFCFFFNTCRHWILKLLNFHQVPSQQKGVLFSLSPI